MTDGVCYIIAGRPATEDKHICIKCRTRSDEMLCCERCNVVRYCSQECRDAARSVHKLGCDEAIAHRARVATMLSGDAEAARAAGLHGMEKVESWINNALRANGRAPESWPYALIVAHEASDVARSIEESPVRDMLRGAMTPARDGANRIYLVSIKSAHVLLFNYSSGTGLINMHKERPGEMIITRVFADSMHLQFTVQTEPVE